MNQEGIKQQVLKKRLHSKKTKPVIGIIGDSFRNKFAGMISGGIFKAADIFQCDAISIVGCSQMSQSPEKLLDDIAYKLISNENFDGLIILPNDRGEYPETEEIQNFIDCAGGIPVVLAGSKSTELPCVYIDNYNSVYKMTEYLIKAQSCKDILMIRDNSNSPESLTRYEAYKDVLNSNEIPLRKELVISCSKSDKADCSLKEIISKKIKFDAVICTDDYSTISSYYELANNGYDIPKDIKFAGFKNNLGMNDFTAEVTTIHQPYEKLGFECLRLLHAILKGEVKNKKIEIKDRIEFNTSTGETGSGMYTQYDCINSYDKTNEKHNMSRIFLNDMPKKILDIFYQNIYEIANNSDDILKYLTKFIYKYFLFCKNTVAWKSFIFVAIEILRKSKPEKSYEWYSKLQDTLFSFLDNEIHPKKYDYITMGEMINTHINSFISAAHQSESIDAYLDLLKEYSFGFNISKGSLLINQKKRNSNSNELSSILQTSKNSTTVQKDKISLSTKHINVNLNRPNENHITFISSLPSANGPLGFFAVGIDPREMVKKTYALANVVPYFKPITETIAQTIQKYYPVNTLPLNHIATHKKSYESENKILSDIMAKKHFNKLVNFLESEKPFLNPKTTLADLSDSIGISRNHLSYVINSFANTNFYGLLNKYRIEHAKKILAKPAERKNKIIDVAYNSGFSSLSAFYRVFNLSAKCSPQDYRERILQANSSFH